MQNATIHIKVKPEIAKGLKELSKKRDTSVGELVRQALFSCYQLDILGLNEKHRRALEAFQGGYISPGKLAEEMRAKKQWVFDTVVLSNMITSSFYSPVCDIKDIL